MDSSWTRDLGSHTAENTASKNDFGWGSGALIKEMFRIFDRDRDGALNCKEYSAFCLLTEGKACDDTRYRQHCKALSVDDPDEGMRLVKFAQLYNEARFKRHFGKVRSELEKVKEARAGKAASSRAGGSGARVPLQPRQRRGAMRHGSAASAVAVHFTEKGTLGIEWDAGAVLATPNYAREVRSMLMGPPADTGADTGNESSASPTVDFTPAESFDRVRPGYVFKNGEKGLGYYREGPVPAAAPPDMVSEETEYGCCITGIQADSIAAQNAALVCGLILQMVNGENIEGMETDDIIDMIAGHDRSATTPLVLRLVAPRASITKGDDPTAVAEPATDPKASTLRIQWADQVADDEPEVDDMFARQAKRQRTLADTQQVAGASSSATTSVSFAVRVQQELAEYAQTLKLEKEKKAKLENIQTIRSRADPDELDNVDEVEEPKIEELPKGPTRWGKAAVSTSTLSWGGAKV